MSEGRDLSKLTGDALTWALHDENKVEFATVNSKLNLVIGFLFGGMALFASILAMRG